MANLEQSINPKEHAAMGLAKTSEELKFAKPLTLKELKVIEKQIMPFLEKDPVSALGWLSITNPEIFEAFTKDALHKTELYLKALGENEYQLGSFMDVRLANRRAEIFREKVQEAEQRPIEPLPPAEANVVVLGKLPFTSPKSSVREFDLKEGALRGSKKGGIDRLKLNRSEVETLLHELNHVAHSILETIFKDRQSLDPNLTSPENFGKYDVYFYSNLGDEGKPDPIQVLKTEKGFGKKDGEYQYFASPDRARPFANKTHEAIYRLLSDKLFTEDLAFYNSEVVSQGKLMPSYFEQTYYSRSHKFPQIGMPLPPDRILSKYTTQGGILPSDREYIKTLDRFNKTIQTAAQSVLDDLQYTVKENIMQKKDMIPPKDNVYTLIQELKTGKLNEEKEDDEWSISGFIKNLFNK